MAKRIFVLGAGYAGIEAAMTLHKRKKKTEDIEIYLVDKNYTHTPASLLHEVAGDRISEEFAAVPLRDIFKYTGVKLIRDEITGIDYENKKLSSAAGEYSYDYLVVATGSQPDSHNVPGAEGAGFTLGSMEDAVKLREHVKSCFYKASSEKNPEKRKALLTFVIGGAGLSGTEMAAELSHLVKRLCREYDMPRMEAKVVLVEAKSTILGELSDKNAKKAADYLTRKLKVEIMTGSEITGADSDTVRLKSRKVIPAKTLIWTAGIKGAIPGGAAAGEDRMKVDAFVKTQYPGVYAAGSAALFDTGEYILPAMATFALQSGRRAALNILADIRGKAQDILQPKLYGLAVSMGSFHAAGNFVGVRLYSLLAVILNYFFNLKYLFHIGGFELAITYLKQEFLHRRHEQFLLEKHYTKKSNIYWLVPIRMFLGYAWLMEGITKVKEGWFTKALLAGTPADAESGASATETGEKVFRIVADHTPGWYAWIADTIIVPNALIFQFMITLTEIGLGLALITGTFTFFAGLASIGLNLNFLLSTGMYPETWWYFPAALCVLGGAGRAFGVDHYLMPYLMRQWRFFIRNKRLRIWLFR